MDRKKEESLERKNKERKIYQKGKLKERSLKKKLKNTIEISNWQKKTHQKMKLKKKKE